MGVSNGNTIGKVDSPTRNGFNFAGWFRDFNITIPFDTENDVVTRNMTLYAKWSPDGAGEITDGFSYAWHPANGLSDSSQIARWNSEERQLSVWNANQLGGFPVHRAPDDVVSPELRRITGIHLHPHVLDNNGMSARARRDQFVNADAVPHIAFGGSEIGEIIDPDLVHDLTDYLHYIPSITRRMPSSVWNHSNVNGGQRGKVFGIPYNLGDVGLSQVDPLADSQRGIQMEFQHEFYAPVRVREDILLDLREMARQNPAGTPEHERWARYARIRSIGEVQSIFQENGRFTEEELFDVDITSFEDFLTFLGDVQFIINTQNAISGKYRDGSRIVHPILAQDGQDRDAWSPLSSLFGKLLNATGPLNTMFAYWDSEQQQVDLMLRQPWYQEMLREWARLVQIGNQTSITRAPIMSNYGNTIRAVDVQQEVNRGLYAVVYEHTLPANDRATFQGRTINYRKMYMRIPQHPNLEFFAIADPRPSSVVIFKTVPESAIPQILRYLDLQASEIGDRLLAWGSQTSGLFFLNENGEREFHDIRLAVEMTRDRAVLGENVRRFNLSNASRESARPTFPFFYNGGSKDHPLMVYDVRDDLSRMYSSSAIGLSETNDRYKIIPIVRRADMHTWTDLDLHGIQTVWSRRGTIEQSLKRLLFSETPYSNFDTNLRLLTIAMDQAGWTSAFFNGRYTDVFLELNRDFTGGFLK
jgi:uncharacterized repeat protein (TIGR02543 family)